MADAVHFLGRLRPGPGGCSLPKAAAFLAVALALAADERLDTELLASAEVRRGEGCQGGALALLACA